MFDLNSRFTKKKQESQIRIYSGDRASPTTADSPPVRIWCLVNRLDINVCVVCAFCVFFLFVCFFFLLFYFSHDLKQLKFLQTLGRQSKLLSLKDASSNFFSPPFTPVFIICLVDILCKFTFEITFPPYLSAPPCLSFALCNQYPYHLFPSTLYVLQAFTHIFVLVVFVLGD